MHLTDAQLEGFSRRTLPPTDLLAVDDHLAACDACRRRAAVLAGVAGALADLQSGLLPIESHLSDAQVVEYATGALSAGAKASVESHLGKCATCAREVDEARADAGRRQARPWAAYTVAAALLIGLALSALVLRRPSSDPFDARTASLAGLESLPAADQDRVRAALRAGEAELPPQLAHLETEGEVLMGDASPASFQLIQPLATLTITERPTFRWQAVPGAGAYTVSLSDEAARPVARSPAIQGTEWTPDEPLQRGRTYLWQVTAERGAEHITAPAPPAPPARFSVLTEQTAVLLGAVARDYPQSHLLLGILYAQSGARDEAAAHLAQVPTADPLFETARRTLERVRRRP